MNTSNLLIKCLIISTQEKALLEKLCPVNNLTILSDLPGDYFDQFTFNWLVLDLDFCPIKDSELLKSSVAFIAKDIKVISKDFNRLKYYEDFCSVYFGWNNFIELNFFL